MGQRQKAPARSSETRLGDPRSQARTALPATAARGQQHLVLETPRPIWSCDQVGRSFSPSANDGRGLTGGLWGLERGLAQGEIQGQPHLGS